MSVFKFTNSVPLAYVIDMTIFNILIVANLLRKEPDSQFTEQYIINEFPEALYFWNPNHFFHLYLNDRHSSLLNYRPLMADILRYDYQIDEAMNRPLDR